MKAIYLGEHNRSGVVRDYLRDNTDIEKVIIIGNPLSVDVAKSEHIPMPETIMYRTYYRLLQQIDTHTLLVLNECLTKRNRYDLAYNCVRKYLLQTPHALVFNYYPIIREQEDFMILYDFIQENPFLKEAYRYVSKFERVHIGDIVLDVERKDVTFSDDVVAEYEAEKERIIGQVKKIADIIPRRLLKWADNRKPKGFDRLDIIKPRMRVCVSNLGVDRYYFSEIENLKKELNDVVQTIHG